VDFFAVTAQVRLWHLADIDLARLDVRYRRQSGHRAVMRHWSRMTHHVTSATVDLPGEQTRNYRSQSVRLNTAPSREALLGAGVSGGRNLNPAHVAALDGALHQA
jgi:hypothetical protein